MRHVSLRGAPTARAAQAGRRYPEGQTGDFKLFTFGLSQATGVPILPVTLAGVGRIQPVGAECLRAGEATVTCAPRRNWQAATY